MATDRQAPPSDFILPARVTHSPPPETHLPATDRQAPPSDFILPARVTHSPPMETHLPATDRQAPPFLFGTCWGECNSPQH